MTNGYLLSLRQPDPARRLARRPLRPAPGVRGRRRWFAVGLRALRPRAEPGGPDRGPRAAGHRRGAAHPGQPGDDPGRLRARGPGTGDRRLVGTRRDRRGDRPVRRRRPGRLRELALDLPHQPASRRGHGADRGPRTSRRPATRTPRATSTGGARCSPRWRSAGRRTPSSSGAVRRPWSPPASPWSPPVGFVLVERREAEPMLQLGLFARPHVLGVQRDDVPGLRRARRHELLRDPPAADRRGVRRAGGGSRVPADDGLRCCSSPPPAAGWRRGSVRGCR